MADSDDFAAIIADPDAPQAEKDLAGALWSADRALTMLAECVAELDRLRVIADLACAEHEALRAYMASEVTEPGTEPWVVWQSAREDCHDAVDEEVARRAAL